MSYYQNLAKRSVEDGTRVGAAFLGAATGAAAIGAAFYFAPPLFLFPPLAGLTIFTEAKGTFIVLATAFIIGAIPGILAGAVAGSTVLTPFAMAFHAITQKRIADNSIKDTMEKLGKLKSMSDDVIKVVINDIIARYEKSKSFSASKSSKTLLTHLKDYSHGQDKLKLT